MKRISTIFLQIVTVLIGIITLFLLIREPQLEGRNVNSTLYEIYFKDPFLAFAYLGSISFFVILFQIFRLLGFIRQDKIFTTISVKALRIIKICALILITFIAGAIAYFFIVQRGKEDIAGGVSLGLIMVFIVIVTGTAAGVFERILQKAIDMKSENDLTI